MQQIQLAHSHTRQGLQARRTILYWQLFNSSGLLHTEHGLPVVYVDPLADDRDRCLDTIDGPAVFLWAHNRQITYDYTGTQEATKPYCEIQPGSVIVDPWRSVDQNLSGITVLHYGNTRRL